VCVCESFYSLSLGGLGVFFYPVGGDTLKKVKPTQQKPTQKPMI